MSLFLSFSQHIFKYIYEGDREMKEMRERERERGFKYGERIKSLKETEKERD
jgi:hypothetical protein